MKAAVINKVGDGFHVEDVEIAEPIGREVKVDVRAAGLCHTDLLAATVDMGYPMPAIMGHELAGVVSAVGPGVTSLKVGDRVMGCLLQSCGLCPACSSGKPFQCSHPESTLRGPDAPPRVTRDGEAVSPAHGLGAFAQQALVHENQLGVVPDSVPFAQAALIGCGVMTGAGSVLNTARVRPGESVVVIGAGGVGVNAISAARIAGASRIVAVDINDVKLDGARRFGATDTVNSRETDPVAAVHEITGGGADYVFDFVGNQTVANQGLEMLGVGGRLHLIGVAGNDDAVSVSVVQAVLKQFSVTGVTLGSSNFRRDLQIYAGLYAQGRMNLDDLVSRQIRLEEINEGYEMLHDPSVTRVVITEF